MDKRTGKIWLAVLLAAVLTVSQLTDTGWQNWNVNAQEAGASISGNSASGSVSGPESTEGQDYSVSAAAMEMVTVSSGDALLAALNNPAVSSITLENDIYASDMAAMPDVISREVRLDLNGRNLESLPDQSLRIGAGGRLTVLSSMVAPDGIPAESAITGLYGDKETVLVDGGELVWENSVRQDHSMDITVKNSGSLTIHGRTYRLVAGEVLLATVESVMSLSGDEARVLHACWGEEVEFMVPPMAEYETISCSSLRVVSGALPEQVGIVAVTNDSSLTRIVIEEGNGAADMIILNSSPYPVEALVGRLYVEWRFLEGWEDGGLNKPATVALTTPQALETPWIGVFYGAGEEVILTPQEGYTIYLDTRAGMEPGRWDVQLMTNGVKKVKIPVVAVENFTYGVSALGTAEEGAGKDFMVYQRRADGTLAPCAGPGGYNTGNVVIVPSEGYRICRQSDIGENTLWQDQLELSQDGVDVSAQFRLILAPSGVQSESYGLEKEGSITYTKDGAPPVIGSVRSDLGDTEWTSGNVTLTVSGSDALSGMNEAEAYSFDGGLTWQGGSRVYENNVTLSPNTIQVRDIAGNVASYPETVHIRGIDRDAPVITWSVEPGWEGVDESRHLIGHVEDASLKEIRLYEGTSAQGAYRLLDFASDNTFRLPLKEEACTYTVEAWDMTGGSSQSIKTVDALSHDLAVTAPAAEGIYGDELPVAVSLSNSAAVAVRIQSVELTGTDGAKFRLDPVEPFELSGGQRDERIRVVLPGGSRPGSYQAGLKIIYLNGSGEETFEQISLNVTVKKGQLTPQILVLPKTYDGSADAQVSLESIGGVVPGDQVLVNATGVYDSGEAGAGRRVTVDYAVSGQDAAYYEALQPQIIEDCVIDKAQGTGSVSVDTQWVGEALQPRASSDTNGTGAVSFYYKGKDEADSAYTLTKPEAAGEYMVKAVFAATSNYEEAVASAGFTLSYMQPEPSMFAVSGTQGTDGWYLSDVTLAGQGVWQVSLDRNGPFTDAVTVQNTGTPFLYLRNSDTGALTEGYSLEFLKIDKTPPRIGEGEGIRIGTDRWSSFAGSGEPPVYLKEAAEGSLAAHDDESGVLRTSYLVSEREYTREELEAAPELFREGDRFTLGTEAGSDTDGRYYVYARFENHAGLSACLGTGAILLDRTAPVVRGDTGELADGAVLTGTLHGTVTDLALKELVLYKDGSPEGRKLEVGADGSFTVEPASGTAEYVLSALDMAGNETRITFTMEGFRRELLVTAERVEGAYGEDIPVPVEITNTGTGSITINEIRLKTHGDEYFVLETPALPYTLEAGQSVAGLRISAAPGLKPGDYAGQLVIRHVNSAGRNLKAEAELGLDVGPRALQADSAGIPREKVYDGTVRAGTEKAVVRGILPGDEVTADITAEYDSAEAGEGRSIRVTYALNGKDAAYYTAPEAETITGCRILRAPGTGSVTAPDRYVGERITVRAVSETNGTGNVEIYYKGKDEADSAYTRTEPGEAGVYTVKAVFAATSNYEETAAYDEFRLAYLPVSNDMLKVDGAKGPLGWYRSDVTLAGAEGWSVSLARNGAFTDRLTLSDTAGQRVYMQNKETGARTEGLALDFIHIDRTGPELGEGEGIQIGKHVWNAFMDEISYRVYSTEDLQGEIAARDGESGIASVSYLVSDRRLTMEEVKNSQEFQAGPQVKIGGSPYGRYVVYARIVNGSGLEMYLSSDGLVIDKNPPVLTGLNHTLWEGVLLNGDLQAKVSDEEWKELRLYRGKDSSGDFVFIEPEQDGGFTIAQEENSVEYTLSAADKAGNRTLLHFTIEGKPGEMISARSAGSGGIACEDRYVGEEPGIRVWSQSNGIGNVSLYYKRTDAPDSAYSAEYPREEGAYTVKAVFAETGLYEEAVAYGEFSLSYLEPSSDMYRITGTGGPGGWYRSDITVWGEGSFSVALDRSGEWSKSVTLADTEGAVLYLRDDTTGALTQGTPLDFLRIDQKEPVIEGVMEGESYALLSLEIRITDENLNKVTVNGAVQEVLGGSFTVSLEAEAAVTEYLVQAEDLSGNVSSVEFTLQKPKGRLITEGRIKLEAGVLYQLGEGRWKITGDSTIYEGGSDFYVTTDGTYEFTRQ